MPGRSVAQIGPRQLVDPTPGKVNYMPLGEALADNSCGGL